MLTLHILHRCVFFFSIKIFVVCTVKSTLIWYHFIAYDLLYTMELGKNNFNKFFATYLIVNPQIRLTLK